MEPEAEREAGRMGEAKKTEDFSDLTIEEMFEQLDGVIRQLEDGEITLDDSFARYEAGMKLIKACGERLDRVEKQILVIDGQEEEEG